MKKYRISIMFIMFLAGNISVFAKEQTEEFKVSGKCDMCKSRIESAAKALNGVAIANWDKKTQEMTVTYNSEKVSLKQIQTAITMKGHSTEIFKVSDKRYAELPECCKYPRSENSGDTNNDNSGCKNTAKSGSCCNKD